LQRSKTRHRIKAVQAGGPSLITLMLALLAVHLAGMGAFLTVPVLAPAIAAETGLPAKSDNCRQVGTNGGLAAGNLDRGIDAVVAANDIELTSNNVERRVVRDCLRRGHETDWATQVTPPGYLDFGDGSMPTVLRTQAAIARAPCHTTRLSRTRLFGEDKIAEPAIRSRIRPEANIELAVLRAPPIQINPPLPDMNRRGESLQTMRA